MRGTTRVVAGIAVAAFGVLAASMAGAAPALAMNPCNSDNPPDYCFDPAPPPTPSAPTNLVATSVLQTSVSLQWTDNAAGESSYIIQRSLYNQPTTVLTAPANSTSFTDTGAPAGSYIDYYVQAQTCDALTGLCSTSATAHVAVSTHPQPANPTWGGLTQNLWGSTYYWSGWTIDWDTTAPIQVAVTSDNVVQNSYTAGNAVANLNTTYPGYGNNHGFSVQAAKSTVKGNHTLCLVAYNVGGGANVNLICQPYYVPGPPLAATNLKLTNTGTSIVITFTDNANDETGFWLQRSTDNGASWLSVGSEYAPISGSGGTGTATDYSSPAAGTQYRILMINASGNTPSAAVTV